MSVNKRASLTRIVVVTFLLFSFESVAQERGGNYLRGGNAAELASYYMLNADLVAVGRFAEPADLGQDEIALLRSREIDLSFFIERVFVGDLQVGDTVVIRLRNDMLVYPGGNVSRYEKRFRLFEEASAALASEAEEVPAIEDAFEAGNISRSERDKQMRDLDSRNASLIALNRDLLGIQRRVNASHSSTFYQKGGVIRPNTPYLVAVNMIEGNHSYYLLRETDFGIMWGDLAADVRGKLNSRGLDVPE